MLCKSYISSLVIIYYVYRKGFTLSKQGKDQWGIKNISKANRLFLRYTRVFDSLFIANSF